MVEQQTFPFADGGSSPTSPLQFHIKEIEYDLFVALNRKWHSRLPDVGGFYINGIFFGAFYDSICYAVAGWSQPVAREFLGRNYLELRRLAIAPDAPKNTASRILSVMARYLRGHLPNVVKLISYQDVAVHTGTIYKASGWKKAYYRDRGKEQIWHNVERKGAGLRQTPGINGTINSPKIRWEIDLPAHLFKAKG